MKFEPTKYKLENISTSRRFDDEGWLLTDPQSDKPSLIRAIYEKKQIEFKDDSCGIYKFSDWMPIHRTLLGSCAPITYKSKHLAKEFGLSNLYITFSGYWPEIGANMQTCSFKETEAYTVCGRLPKDNKKILVVASAGNTARAFAQVCSNNNIPLLITIPQEQLDALWFKKPLNDCVKFICTPPGSDYYDAIALAGKLVGSDNFIDEGGAKNVARRDGMATTVLSATQFIGKIPDFYFQAVGSGTGTIAAHESNIRLIEDGRFGNNMMKLIPSQNVPFTPMYDAWKAQSRSLLPICEDEARQKALKVDAKVLSNRKPPFSVPGGLFDSLKASNGDMIAITNEELELGCQLFEKLEGIDIYSASGVAVESLRKAIEKNIVAKNDIIMLNITGGGELRFKREHKCVSITPDFIFDIDESPKNVIKQVEILFHKREYIPFKKITEPNKKELIAKV